MNEHNWKYADSHFFRSPFPYPLAAFLLRLCFQRARLFKSVLSYTLKDING